MLWPLAEDECRRRAIAIYLHRDDPACAGQRLVERDRECMRFNRTSKPG